MRAKALWLFLLLAAGCAREAAGPKTPARAEAYPAPAPAPTVAQPVPVSPAAPASTEDGQATYYSDSLAGRRTASGERYDPRAFSAAHRTLPFGTEVRVTRLDSGQSVVVRINDRGPFGNARRIIDLSRAAAEQLEMIRAGVVPVRVEAITR